jgi:hypothetical protein
MLAMTHLRRDYPSRNTRLFVSGIIPLPMLKGPKVGAKAGKKDWTTECLASFTTSEAIFASWNLQNGGACGSKTGLKSFKKVT